jgi:hypothetical protein
LSLAPRRCYPILIFHEGLAADARAALAAASSCVGAVAFERVALDELPPELAEVRPGLLRPGLWVRLARFERSACACVCACGLAGGGQGLSLRLVGTRPPL